MPDALRYFKAAPPATQRRLYAELLAQSETLERRYLARLSKLEEAGDALAEVVEHQLYARSKVVHFNASQQGRDHVALRAYREARAT